MSIKKIIITAILLSSSSSIVIAGNNIVPAQADCLFNWGELNYPSLFSPANTQSRTFDSYYYRYYSPDTYLGTSSADGHLYYIGALSGNALMDLGEASVWINQASCSGSSALAGSEAEVKNHVDTLFGLTNEVLGGDLTNQVQPILMAALGQPSTCPVVAMNFNLSEATDLESFLQNLPKPAIANISYGNGCIPVDSSDTMTGQAELRLNNLDINQMTGEIQANLDLIVNNLAKNAQIISDGKISINLGLGAIDADTGSFSGGGTIQLSNYLIPNGMRLQGAININSTDDSNMDIGINVSDSNNTIHAVFDLIASNLNDEMTLNTTTPGTLNQYAVVFDAIKYNTDVCEAYPIGGDMIFSANQQSWTVTFDSRCDGSYLVK
ncbi:MAG: hypothetical protein K9L22_00880 [Methylococcaceae bacterium]|nr:hypothetical protein [Methylococcaceae bacterium]